MNNQSSQPICLSLVGVLPAIKQVAVIYLSRSFPFNDNRGGLVNVYRSRCHINGRWPSYGVAMVFPLSGMAAIGVEVIFWMAKSWPSEY